MSKQIDEEVSFKRAADPSERQPARRQEPTTKKAWQVAPPKAMDSEVNPHYSDSNTNVEISNVDHEEIVTDVYEDIKSDGELESSATTDDGVETSESDTEEGPQISKSDGEIVSDGSPHSSDVDVTYRINSDYSDLDERLSECNCSESEMESDSVIDQDLSDNIESGIDEFTSSCVES